MVPNQGGIPPQEGIFRVQGRNFHFVVSSPIHSQYCASVLCWHWRFQLVRLVCHSNGLSHVFWRSLAQLFDNKWFCPTRKLLPSIKSIVPIAVNTSPRTRTINYTVTGKSQVRNYVLVDHIFLQTHVIGEEWKKNCVIGEEQKVPKWAKGGCFRKGWEPLF